MKFEVILDKGNSSTTMDSEYDTIPYLKLFSENSGNYLLQNSYELQDTLPVESFFTEMEAGSWPSECLPILLNGSVGDEDNGGTVEDGSDTIIEQPVVYEEANSTENYMTPHAVDSALKEVGKCKENLIQKAAVSSSGTVQSFLIPQNLLLQVNNSVLDQIKDIQLGNQKRSVLLQVNGTTYAINYSSSKSVEVTQKENCNQKVLPESKTANSEELTEVWSPIEEMDQMSSKDFTISENNNGDAEDLDDLLIWKDFYSILTAMKCKVCSFLCESKAEMAEHLYSLHGDLMKLKKAAEKENQITRSDVKMKSSLHTNHFFLENHNDNSITLFMCSFCNNIFATREILMDHIIKVHDQSSNSKDSVDIKSEESGDDIRDAKSKTSMRIFATALIKKQQKCMRKVKCTVKGCTLKFANIETKVRHEECHVPDKKQFQCPACKEKFSIWRMCSKHLWISHKIDAGLYTCPLCNNYKSNSPAAVVNHMLIHNFERPFECTDCGKGFKQLTQLKNHAVIHKNTDELPAWSSSRKCTICERYFANTKSLKKHVQSVHEKFKPYICNICGHKTTRKAMLELHLRQHTGDKPHQCPHCTYRTGDHNCLRKHIMKHYGSMKYSCPHCKYQAIQSSAYKHHVESRHPNAGGTYKCTLCTFTTVNCETYTSHVKFHELSQKAEKSKIENESSNNGNTREVQQEGSGNEGKNNETDDDGAHIYLHLTDNGDHCEDIIDTGGITIPAGFEMQLAQ